MFRIISTRHLRTLHADLDDAAATEQTLHAAITDWTSQHADATTRAAQITEEAELLRAELDRQATDWSATIHQLRTDLDHTRTELEAAQAELEAARAQVLLDAEDRVALRALLRTARREAARADRVYLLYRHGRLHSVHTSLSAAEDAAEAEGAARSGWRASSDPVPSTTPGEAEPPWLICPQRVGGQ